MITEFKTFRGTKEELINHFSSFVSSDKDKKNSNSYYELDDAPIAKQIEEADVSNKFKNGESNHSFGLIFLLFRNETSLSVVRFYIHVADK